MFDTILPYLLAGVSVGGQYALIAVGYTMVYGILRLINFAHGDIFTAAGFFMVYLTATLPLSISGAAGDSADRGAGLRSGARGLQASALCAAHVHHDFRHRHVLSAAKFDVVCDGRSGEAVSGSAVAVRYYSNRLRQHEDRDHCHALS